MVAPKIEEGGGLQRKIEGGSAENPSAEVVNLEESLPNSKKIQFEQRGTVFIGIILIIFTLYFGKAIFKSSISKGCL